MRVAIAGGSAAGLVAALLLARAGHEVLVLEREDLAPAADVDAAAESAFRASAPQIVQPHVLLATCRTLLRDHLPDVYGGLLAAGVVEAPISTQMPPTLADRTPRPGDEDLTVLATRRSTVDWVLRRAAAAEPGVRICHGVQIEGLVTEPGDPPRVTGLRTSAGSFAADLVVDAAGRRSAVARWLDAAGAPSPSSVSAECGLAYFSRHYRIRPGATLPGPPESRVVAGLDEFTVGIWAGDGGTMQVALAPLAADRRFRTAKAPAVFTAVLRTVPTYAAWLDGLDPVTDVFVMGGLHNTLRRLVVDGRPVALGLLALGDAVCTTNPTFGRGLGLLVRGALDLVDAVAAHPDDAYTQAVALDDAVGRHIAPWFADQAASDAARLAILRQTVLGRPAPPRTGPPAERVTFAQVRAAGQVDPVAFRAIWRVMGTLGTPDEVYADPDLVARVRAVLADGPPPVMAQPTRDELQESLAA